jgi:hypothetical protein
MPARIVTSTLANEIQPQIEAFINTNAIAASSLSSSDISGCNSRKPNARHIDE